MRIAMIGTGYVGLVSGACFSEFGVTVTCVDKDAAKIERLSRGEMPIYEPELEQLVMANRAGGRPAFVHHGARAGRGRGGRRLYRRRHPVAARRRACRSLLRFCRGRGDRAGARRRSGKPRRAGDQIDRAGRHRKAGRGNLAAGLSRRPFRCRLEPRIPARGLGDRGFHAPRPGRHRHRGRRRPRLPAIRPSS
jgi:hypothetical protein